MIGLDTNALVRHLVQDDSGQSRKATQRNDQRVRNAIPKDVLPDPTEMIVILEPIGKEPRSQSPWMDGKRRRRDASDAMNESHVEDGKCG